MAAVSSKQKTVIPQVQKYGRGNEDVFYAQNAPNTMST